MKKKIMFVLSIIVSLIAILFNYDFIYSSKLTTMSLNMFNGTLVLLLIKYIIFNKKYNLKDISLSKKILSGIFTFCMIIGEIITVTGNFMYLFRLPYFILTIVKVIGFYITFTYLYKLLDYSLSRLNNKDLKK